MAVALHRLGGSPFAPAAGAALRKLVAVMPPAAVAEAHRLAGRVHLVGDGPGTPVPAAVADAVAAGRVLRLRYADRGGTDSLRDVEPLGLPGQLGALVPRRLVPAARRSALLPHRPDRVGASAGRAGDPGAASRRSRCAGRPGASAHPGLIRVETPTGRCRGPVSR